MNQTNALLILAIVVVIIVALSINPSRREPLAVLDYDYYPTVDFTSHYDFYYPPQLSGARLY